MNTRKIEKALTFFVFLIWILFMVSYLGSQIQGGYKAKIKYSHSSTTTKDTIGYMTTIGERVDESRKGTASFETWYMQGIGDSSKDTSRVYPIYPYMTFGFTLTDTSASDSDVVKVKFYQGDDMDGGLPAFRKFELIDSTTIHGDSAQTKWYVYTKSGSNRPNTTYWYLTAEGADSNITASYTKVEIEYKGME